MKYARDPWLQIFAFLALASGALAAFGSPLKPAPRFAAAEPAPVAAAPLPPPAPRAAPAADALSAGLKPKIAGKWVVDATLASDADTAKLGEAAAAAASGDTIYVRAGVYKGGVAFKRDVSLIGLGARAQIVLDSDQAGPTVSVDGAKATLQNLTISHSGSLAGKAVESRRANLTLSGVDLKSGPLDVGLDAAGGEASVSDGTVKGGHKALDLHDEAKATLSRMNVTGAETGIFVQDASVELRDASLTEDKRGLFVSEQGQATISSGEFLHDDTAVWANRGGRVTASFTRFNLDGTGVQADDGGRVDVSSAAFFGMTSSALLADTAGEIDDAGSAILRSRGVAVSVRGRATIKLAGTRVEDGTGDGVDAADGASVSLSAVRLNGNAGAGLSVRGARDARVEGSVFSHQSRCGVELESVVLELRGTRLTDNQCAVSFLGQAVLDANSSVLTGNRQGPFHYSAEEKNEIVVRGADNQPADLAALIK